MPRTIEELRASHPCFAYGAPNNKGRVHLPVSPGCNLLCRFCQRDVNAEYGLDNRPGVSGGIITPDEAVEVLRRAIELCPEITVAGIAGPGDTLATPYALETFRKIRREFPGILCCMSTNGLLLNEKAREVIEAGVDTLTVTVNAVDPAILEKINGGIVWQGKLLTGIKAAKLLIENQLKGIEKVAKAGIAVKVNTVLIPEINTLHVPEVAEKVAARGARLYNIIPLIPQNELDWCSRPGCALLDLTRQKCERYIQVFRHCQHCRADAAGIPGGVDVSRQLYIRPVTLENTFSHG
ncbi:MAG: radical SAM protein [bacterium]